MAEEVVALNPHLTVDGPWYEGGLMGDAHGRSICWSGRKIVSLPESIGFLHVNDALKIESRYDVAFTNPLGNELTKCVLAFFHFSKLCL